MFDVMFEVIFNLLIHAIIEDERFYHDSMVCFLFLCSLIRESVELRILDNILSC
jgi:hypothetical protein